MAYDPIVIVPNGYSIQVIVHRPADEVSRVRLTWFEPSASLWTTLWDFNTDSAHYRPLTIYGPTIPIGGIKLQLEAWNRWGGGQEWPMSGDRTNLPNKVVLNYTVEPGQSNIATYVEFVMQRVAYALVGSDQDLDQFNISFTKK